MKSLLPLACLSSLLFVAACAPAGYYDSNGVYRSYGYSDSFRNNRPGSDTPPASGRVYERTYYSTTPTTTIIYDRPGYYDYNGYYIENGPRAPRSMFPPRGMCRVWFTDRTASDQPPIESCEGIRSRVPAGAYVIYGG